MKFKYWIENNSNFSQWLVEFMDVKSMSTKEINLEKKHIDSPIFDEDLAWENCSESVRNYVDRTDYYEDVYDDFEEDPNFYEDYEVIDPEFWLEENPEPSNEEEHEEWEKEYKSVNDSFHKAVVDWKDNMHQKRTEAEEKMQEEIDSLIEDCVLEARSEWEYEHEDQVQDSVVSNFQVDEDDFEVTFERSNIRWKELDIENVWDITFEGPNGTNLTNKNKNSTLIYKNLLLSIKKLIETEPVNGLTFGAASPHMTLVYNQFFKQFLSKDFIPIDVFSFVRKDTIRKFLRSNIDQNLKLEIIKKISSAFRNTRSEVDRTKKEKQKLRSLIRDVPIGELFYNTNAGKIFPLIIHDAHWGGGNVIYKVFITKTGFYETELKKMVSNFSHNPHLMSQILKIEEIEETSFNSTYVNFQKMEPPKFNINLISIIKNAILKLIQEKHPVKYKKINFALKNNLGFTS